MKIRSNSGFTLLEILIAIALGLVILAGLFQTFRTQHDTYIVQDQVAAMQQNMRAAMYMITRDLQMAGYYTNFVKNNRILDLGDLGNVNGRLLLFSTPPGAAGNIKPDTDAIVIVKARENLNPELADGEGASGNTININLASSGLDPATDNKKYGLLVKNDLRSAEFFELSDETTVNGVLSDAYEGKPETPLSEKIKADMLFRVDIVIYKIEIEGVRPMLKRKNLGTLDQYHTVAEDIDNLQVRYQILNPLTNSLEWSDTLTAANQNRVRAVEVLLVGRTAFPQRGYTDTNTITFGGTTIPAPNDNYRRKSLSTIVKTRNVGL